MSDMDYTLEAEVADLTRRCEKLVARNSDQEVVITMLREQLSNAQDAVAHERRERAHPFWTRVDADHFLFLIGAIIAILCATAALSWSIWASTQPDPNPTVQISCPASLGANCGR